MHILADVTYRRCRATIEFRFVSETHPLPKIYHPLSTTTAVSDCRVPGGAVVGFPSDLEW